MRNWDFRKIFVLSIFLISAGCSSSEETPAGGATEGGWVQSSHLSRGVFHAIALDPENPSVSYAASSTVGLFKSSDGGTTWRPFNQGLPSQPIRSLFVDPVDSKTIYAALVGGGLFQTSDAAQTWRAISLGSQTDVRTAVFNPHAPPAFLQVGAANGSNTLRWGLVPNATRYLLYVCTATPCASTPPADGWTELPLSPDQTTKGEFLHNAMPDGTPVANDTRYYYVVKAVVKGVESLPSSKVSAVPKSPPFVGSPDVPFPSGVTITSGDTQNVLRWNSVPGADTTYTVYKSSTPGVSAASFDKSIGPISDVTFVDTQLPNGAPVYYVVTATRGTTESRQSSPEVSAVPQPMRALFVGTGAAGIIAGGPKGEFPTAVTAGLSTDGREVSSLLLDRATMTDPHPTLYLGARDGVYRLDGERIWRPYKATDLGTSLPAVLSLVPDFTVPGAPTLYAGTAKGIFKRDFSAAGVADATRPWTFLDHPTLAVTALALDPSDPRTVYAGTATSGILKSTDAGATWTAVNEGLTVMDIRALVVHPQQPNLLYAGTTGAVFRSTDGGGRWALLDFGIVPNITNLLAVSTVRALVATPGSEQLIYAGTSLGVFKSSDQGTGWAAVNTGLPLDVVSLVIHPTQPGLLYAGAAQQGVYQSLDGGGSWRPENGSSSDALKNITTLIVDPTDPNRLYAGTAGLDVFQGTADADGYLTWSPAVPGSSRGINSLVKVSDSRILFAGTSGQGIFKLPEGASAWVPATGDLSDRNILSLAVHPQDRSIFFAGTATGAYRSVNGGAGWLPISDLQGSEISHFAFDPGAGGAILYAASAEGVFKSIDHGERWSFLGEGVLSNVRALLVDPLQRNIVYAGTVSSGVAKRIQ